MGAYFWVLEMNGLSGFEKLKRRKNRLYLRQQGSLYSDCRERVAAMREGLSQGLEDIVIFVFLLLMSFCYFSIKCIKFIFIDNIDFHPMIFSVPKLHDLFMFFYPFCILSYALMRHALMLDLLLDEAA